MKNTLRVLAPPAAACLAAILLAGCTATAPNVTARRSIDGPDAASTSTAAELSPTPSDTPSTDARVAKLAGAYYRVEATVEGLVTDIHALDQGQAALQMDLRAIEGRIATAESRVVSLTDVILARFDSFESQMTDLRDTWALRTTPAPVTEAPMSTENVISAVNEWRAAWQAGTVTDYLNWYHPGASVTRVSVTGADAKTDEGMDLDKLRKRVQRLRARYTRVDVAIANVEVTHDGNRIVARFRQDFTAWAGSAQTQPSYNDTGTKTLVLVRVGRDLRVIRESWEPTL